VIIPCIDIMGGRVVQLVGGREKALEGGTPQEMLALFTGFLEIQVIDLDAALGQGDNGATVGYLAARVRARVGGGVRSVDRALQLVECGAHRIIIGTSAYRTEGVNAPFLSDLVKAVGRERIVVALDSSGGRVVTRGWRAETPFTAESILPDLAPFCSGFLCTYVDREGTMQGTDLDWYRRLRKLTDLEITAAGGIATMEEIDELARLGVHAALGMSIYTGRLDLRQLRDRADPALARIGNKHVKAEPGT
jgi:phosphoribosylformimino-5-aminoimidazole carboxamide ribonucleotide (ProFAR) isomerase